MTAEIERFSCQYINGMAVIHDNHTNTDIDPVSLVKALNLLYRTNGSLKVLAAKALSYLDGEDHSTVLKMAEAMGLKPERMQ